MAILFFVILAGIVVFPLLAPGYLLTFDMFSVPGKMLSVDFGQTGFLFNQFWNFCSKILPVFWLQKLELFAIFFLAGWGMYRLIKSDSVFPRIFGGLLYIFNPFVYERVLAGHWNFLLGYSMLPFVLKALENILAGPTIKNSIICAILTTLMFIFSLHHVGIFIVVLAIYLVVYFIFSPKLTAKVLSGMIVFVFLVAVLNINWLFPLILGKSGINDVLSQFSTSDLANFKSWPDQDLGLVFNLLSGYGLWTEANHYFILPKEIFSFWPLIPVVLVGLSVFGLKSLWSKKPSMQLTTGISIVILALISLDLATGAISMFYNQVAFARGFREPQKFISLLMLAYAFLGAHGLEYLYKLKKIFLVLIVLPFLYAPTIFAGFWVQLKPTFYPLSWTKVETIVASNQSTSRSVFFPWHQYLHFHFNNGQPLVNPAPIFFGSTVLSRVDHDESIEAKHVDGLLRMQIKGLNVLNERTDERPDWAESLSVIGIKYVILAKEDDWQDYKFLNTAPNFNKVFDDENFTVYENMLVN